MNRREFLTTSTAWAVAGSLAGRSLHASQANSRVRLAFIGVGRQGRGLMGSFLKHADAEIVSLCDVYKPNLDEAAAFLARRGSQGSAPEQVADFRRILDRKDIDAVVVASPDHWHALHAIMACQAGKDVYVEKPSSLVVEEGQKMIEAARRYNRVMQVGTQQRSSVHFQKAIDVVRSGRLGKITIVRTWHLGNTTPDGIGNPPDGQPPAGLDWDAWLGPAPMRPYNANRFGVRSDRYSTFRYFWDYAGGMMTDWGVHVLDIALWGIGTKGPLTVSATGGKFCQKDNSETPDTLAVTYAFPGLVCTFEHRSCNGRGIESQGYGTEFHGTEATLYVNRAGYEVFPENRRVDNKNVPRAEAEQGKTSNDPGESHTRNFLDCIKSRQAPICDIAVEHNSTALCLLGNVAYRTGEKFQWNAEKGEIVDNRPAARLLSVEYRKPWKLKV